MKPIEILFNFPWELSRVSYPKETYQRVCRSRSRSSLVANYMVVSERQCVALELQWACAFAKLVYSFAIFFLFRYEVNKRRLVYSQLHVAWWSGVRGASKALAANFVSACIGDNRNCLGRISVTLDDNYTSTYIRCYQGLRGLLCMI